MDLILLLVSILIGFLLGIFTGLLPGIHVNNIALILVGLSPLFPVSPFYMAIILFSNYIANTFFDIIPSIFIGAPDEETAMAVLPGHKLLLEGRGIEAIRLSAIGSALSIQLSLLFLPVFAILFLTLYVTVDEITPILLVLILLFMIFTEREENVPGSGIFSLSKNKKKIFALVAIFLSGVLGAFAYKYQDIFVPLISIQSSFLFPLLTGLFGTPIILNSIKKAPKIPEQIYKEVSHKPGTIFKDSIIGTISGSLVSWLPGVSSGIATVIAGFFTRGGDKDYIIALSSVNTANAMYTLLFFYLLGIPRSGAIISVNDLIGLISLDWFILFLISSVIVSILSYAFLFYISPLASNVFTKIDYNLLNYIIIIFLSGMILLFTGINGILLFILSISVGLIIQSMNVKRTNAMACIIIPVILMHFGII